MSVHSVGNNGSRHCGSVRSVGDSLNSAYDGVVGRDLMCSCVQSFVIVRTVYTL